MATDRQGRRRRAARRKRIAKDRRRLMVERRVVGDVSWVMVPILLWEYAFFYGTAELNRSLRDANGY